MDYLVMLYDEENTAPQPGTPEWDLDMEGYMAFDELAGSAILGGEALCDSSTARTVRRVEGSVRITNGPFTETAEVLGGYYVLDVASLDDAIELARNIPTAKTGTIEIRPLVMHFGPPPDRTVPEGAERYMATIHGPADEEPAPGTVAWDEGSAEHQRFGESAGEVLLGGAALHPASTATTIRERNGELLVTDGPFAEGNEVTGGFYVLCGTPDEVATVAGRIPVSPGGWVELRPILELDG